MSGGAGIDENTSTTEKRLRAAAQALAAQAAEQRRQATGADYVYDKAQEAYWDTIDGTLHGKDAVDASIPLEHWRLEEAPADESDAPKKAGRPKKAKFVPPSMDIKRVENDQFVESSTWWPGQARIVRDYLITSDGCRPMQGRRAYNTYIPPPEPPRNAGSAARWVEHVVALWPEPAEHNFFFDYCAHMVQRPAEKCNAAIVMSGTQGIGKDAALVPVKMAVGDWNSKNIDPDQLFSDYRPYLQSLMLTIDEVRPSKDEFHASSMYQILKPMIVTPPATLPLNDKYMKLRHIVNVLRLFLTTNDRLSLYIPPEDRRMFIMHSAAQKGWHPSPSYFADYWGWLESGGGLGAVARWLADRDLSGFNPKAEVVKTQGWQSIAGSWDAAEDGIEQSISKLGAPPVIFARELVDAAFDFRDEIAAMVRSPRKICHRMLKAGYDLVKPPAGESWRFQNAATGNDIESRLVFVAVAKFARSADAFDAIRAHGKALAAKPKDGGGGGKF